jgi:[acyl-carrier-protein] S-malonyltransferase
MTAQNAFLFSGQGAQVVGMGKDLAEQVASCGAMARKAAEILDFDVADICFNGPEARLTASDCAQPAIFLVSAMCYTAFCERGGSPAAFMAGLSLGEWTALYAAGVLTFEDTLKILQARGRFMQEACESTKGGMISLLGLTAEQAAEVAEKSGLEVANLNSPVQTVLSGASDRLADAEAMALEAGAKRALVLNVAGAFHSTLMQPAADKLQAFLADIDFATPAVPVVSNVTARPHEADAAAMRAAMVRQVTSSVHWVESVEYMKAQGVSSYVECGPGKVLTGLVKRIDKTAQLLNIQAAVDLSE